MLFFGVLFSLKSSAAISVEVAAKCIQTFFSADPSPSLVAPRCCLIYCWCTTRMWNMHRRPAPQAHSKAALHSSPGWDRKRAKHYDLHAHLWLKCPYTFSCCQYFISRPVTKKSKAHRNMPHGNTRILTGTHGDPAKHLLTFKSVDFASIWKFVTLVIA